MSSSFRQASDQRRRARTREQLLDAALRVFVRDGYHAPKISDLVAAAGLGQGSFYRHFGSKREIFEALVDRFTGSLLAQFGEAFAELPRTEAEYRDASVRSVTAAARVLAANRDTALLILRAGPTVDREMERSVRELLDRFAALARGFLDHAIAVGIARPCDSEVVSQCLVGLGLRLLERGLDGDGDRLEAVVREVVGFAFAGFGPRTGA